MKALVTGATGFLGGALARRLRAEGAQVSGIGRDSAALVCLEAEGITAVRCDLADAEGVRAACAGREVVFHCGALSAPWGRWEDFYSANVLGTQNVIAGCQAGRVGRLVYVSTPSIYFHYNACLNVREDSPLPRQPANDYARSKLMAERLVDRAFEAGLAAITIRPRAIFGPGDTSILPRLIERLQQRRLPLIGDGKNVSDLSYVDNVVDALLLCAQTSPQNLGKKYNITNGEPAELWELVRRLCTELGLEYPRRRVPVWAADAAAAVMELVWRRLPGQPEPPLTRYTVSVLARSTTLEIRAAREELGYQPRISLEQGLALYARAWKAGQA